MTQARLNGIEIDCAVSGRGPAVLLTHGYSATRRMWEGQHRALEKSYQVISWSMRGHGQTESPADPAKYSADLTIADMEALLRHLDVQRAVIGGLSLGGVASLGFYLAHPEMTARSSSATRAPATGTRRRGRPGTSGRRSARPSSRRAG